MRAFGMGALLVTILANPGAPTMGDEDFGAEIARWRKEREARLKADDGWLTLAGLHWLKAGDSRVGGAPDSDVRLPAGAPARVGVLALEDGRASLRVEPGVTVTKDGKPYDGGPLRVEPDGDSDVLAVGKIRLLVIERDGRFALRVKDNDSPARARFAGLRWYPFDPSWRIVGKFEPATTPGAIVTETVVGGKATFESPGFVTFAKDGKSYRIRAAAEDGKLWFIFRDGTSGRTTHPGARQLLADPAGPDGAVVLDFNKAMNLPCAYTPFATCPLAPRENRLALPIAAGEKIYETAPGAARGGDGQGPP